MTENRGNYFASSHERYAGYEVYDIEGERIGGLRDVFVDENDDLEYLGVGSGASGGRFALIPAGAVITFDDGSKRIVVSHDRREVESGPSYGSGEEVTSDYEEQVLAHYGLRGPRSAGRRKGPKRPATLEGPEDELRVQRSEEELKVGIREREAGAVRVSKRVRTDSERIVVPKKSVEVSVERVPVDEKAPRSRQSEAPRPRVEENEIVVPVVEEEVVVEKRPVVREEIRIRKNVAEDTEVVEADVRREEVEVDDETRRRRG